ncbi:WhiB family transcriptional regulator [Mycolicibacterium frederiksbergense]|uniref:WhiB family transcriptional regulator n=1 Tax=Mycolicibacterium frederiksbergense TaxID=117567 RepID=UPI0024745B5A|nr:WhiB family transcriptional regulator [Mycolicibacterium frederiksbergense]
MRTARSRLAEDWSWQLRARCRAADPNLFFHPEGERGGARARRQAQAKQVCATCPVTRQCREHALTFQEAFGTWGGMSEEDRSCLLASGAVTVRTHRCVIPTAELSLV